MSLCSSTQSEVTLNSAYTSPLGLAYSLLDVVPLPFGSIRGKHRELMQLHAIGKSLAGNVTLVCGFVLSISNIFLQFMSTGGDTKHHPKCYQKPHLCENSYRFLFWHGTQIPFVLF
jgi:hypothetical protein